MVPLLITLMLTALPEPDALPVQANLPDPLTRRDGTKITTPDAWQKQGRPELVELFQHYMYGPLPAAPAKMGVKVIFENKLALGGTATLREVELQVGTEGAPPIRLLVAIPNNAKGPVPALVGINFAGNYMLTDDKGIALPQSGVFAKRPGIVNNRATEAGRGSEIDVWNLAEATKRGYAVASFYTGDIETDQPKNPTGLRPFVPATAEPPGTIMLWAWGLMRAVDYLITEPAIDAKKIGTVGHSRLGKTALVAAAFDERIAFAIANQAGCGGSAPSRGTVGESVQKINTSFPHWFGKRFPAFNADPKKLPFDQNGLVALVAPRPVLFTAAVEDTWANPDGQFEVLQGADAVYKLLGVSGLEAKERPLVGTLSNGRLGYFLRPGKHSMSAIDWKAYLDFADKNVK